MPQPQHHSPAQAHLGQDQPGAAALRTGCPALVQARALHPSTYPSPARLAAALAASGAAPDHDGTVLAAVRSLWPGSPPVRPG